MVPAGALTWDYAFTQTTTRDRGGRGRRAEVGASAVRQPVRSQPRPEADQALDQIAVALAALGAESDTARAVKRIAPWVVSVAVHLGMVMLGFLITWTVVRLEEGEQPTLIVADFHDLTYDPLVQLAESEIEEPRPRSELPIDHLEIDVARELVELEVDPLRLISDARSPSPLAEFAPRPPQGTAAFAGLISSNARRLVYVIDASGSMIRSMQIVVEELARSLEGLTPQQSFAVVFFQGNEAVMVPPPSRLAPATPDAKIKALQWIDDHIIPAGRSSPVAAIEMALGLEPDVIFLLSENITGSGQFEIDQQDLLALLEKLNPVDAGTGRRLTQINCVQFLYPDPLRTLEKIAERHGGPRGYKFLDAQELGIAAP